jgi:hypothetical protein
MELSIVFLFLLYSASLLGAYLVGIALFKNFHNAFHSRFLKILFATTIFLVVEFLLRKAIFVFVGGMETGPAAGVLLVALGTFLFAALNIILFITLVFFVRSCLRSIPKEQIIPTSRPKHQLAFSIIFICILLIVVVVPRYEGLKYQLAPVITALVTGAAYITTPEMCLFLNQEYFNYGRNHLEDCIFTSTGLPREEYERECSKAYADGKMYSTAGFNYQIHNACVIEFARKYGNPLVCEFVLTSVDSSYYSGCINAAR